LLDKKQETYAFLVSMTITCIDEMTSLTINQIGLVLLVLC